MAIIDDGVSPDAITQGHRARAAALCAHDRDQGRKPASRASTIVSAAFQMGLAAYRRERLYDIERADAMDGEGGARLRRQGRDRRRRIPAGILSGVIPGRGRGHRRTARRCASASPPPTAIPAARSTMRRLRTRRSAFSARRRRKTVAGRPRRARRRRRMQAARRRDVVQLHRTMRLERRAVAKRSKSVQDRRRQEQQERAEEGTASVQRRAQGGDRRSRRRQPHPLQRGHRRRLTATSARAIRAIPNRFLLSRARAPGLVVAADIMDIRHGRRAGRATTAGRSIPSASSIPRSTRRGRT